MGENDRGPREGVEDLLRAPDHVVDMLLGALRPPPRTPGMVPPPPGSVTYARVARAEARVYADRIWAEAFTRGMAHGMAHAAAPWRVHVTGDGAATFVAQSLPAKVCAHCTMAVFFDGQRWRHTADKLVACINGRTSAAPKAA